MEEPEILVHISAPSGASDDARYRAQVDAILGFQSVSRQNISTTAADEDSYSVSHSPSLSPTAFLSARQIKDQNPSDKAGGAGSLHRSTDPFRNAGDANEDTSVEHVPIPRNQAVPSAPAVASPVRTQSQKRPENDSFGTPVSEIPDSQPEQADPEPETFQHLDPQPPGPVKRRRLESPISKDPNPPSSSHHHHHHLSEPTTAQPHPTTKKAISNVPKTHTTAPSPTANHKTPYIPLTTLPLEIHPPPPTTSTRPFKTHLTATLSMLTKRLPLSRIYKPLYQIRDLHTLERGHWFLRINIQPLPHAHQSPDPKTPKPLPNTWDIAIFTRFWTFLSDFISKEGRAGWGVWCILEGEEKEETVTDRSNCSTQSPPVITEGNQEIEGTKPLTLTLKVYTWGEIASHVYLLLFLASERRIRKMGAQWRDGAEKVVVQM